MRCNGNGNNGDGEKLRKERRMDKLSVVFVVIELFQVPIQVEQMDTKCCVVAMTCTKQRGSESNYTDKKGLCSCFYFGVFNVSNKCDGCMEQRRKLFERTWWIFEAAKAGWRQKKGRYAWTGVVATVNTWPSKRGQKKIVASTRVCPRNGRTCTTKDDSEGAYDSIYECTMCVWALGHISEASSMAWCFCVHMVLKYLYVYISVPFGFKRDNVGWLWWRQRRRRPMRQA